MLGLLLINIIVQMDEDHQRFLEMIQEAEVCIDVYMSHPLTSNLPLFPFQQVWPHQSTNVYISPKFLTAIAFCIQPTVTVKAAENNPSCSLEPPLLLSSVSPQNALPSFLLQSQTKCYFFHRQCSRWKQCWAAEQRAAAWAPSPHKSFIAPFFGTVHFILVLAGVA